MPDAENQPASGGTKALSGRALAAHWGVTAAAVSALKKRKGMPEFKDLAAADAWRSQHCPPRPLSRTAARPAPPAATQPQPPPAQPPTPDASAQADAAITAIMATLPPGMTFEERLARMADVLLDRAFIAVATAHPVNYQVALKNFSETALRGTAAKDAAIDQRLKTREILTLDEAIECVAVELSTVRSAIMRLGETAATAANPDDPARARSAIDAAVDEILKSIDFTAARTTSTLKEGSSDAAD